MTKKTCAFILAILVSVTLIAGISTTKCIKTEEQAITLCDLEPVEELY